MNANNLTTEDQALASILRRKLKEECHAYNWGAVTALKEVVIEYVGARYGSLPMGIQKEQIGAFYEATGFDKAQRFMERYLGADASSVSATRRSA